MLPRYSLYYVFFMSIAILSAKKNSECVMVIEIKDIPVEMAQFRLYLQHQCTVEKICMSQLGFIT